MDIWKNELAPGLDDFIVNEQMICFFLDDGRSVSLPVGLFPALHNAHGDALKNCQATDDGQGLFWPELELTIRFPEFLERC